MMIFCVQVNCTFKHVYQSLPYKVKTWYVQISDILDAFIKHPISGQSTTMVKGCMDIIMFDMVDTAFSYSLI